MLNKAKCFKLIFSLLLLWRFFYKQNSELTVSTHIINNQKVPKNFDNYKIINVSDLHNKSFGKDNINLLSEIRKLNPNMIVVTGDLISAYHPNSTLALNFIKQASKIAPLYFISGNHEVKFPKYTEFKLDLVDSGATVLDNNKVTIFQNEDSINLIGLADPNFYLVDTRYSTFSYILDALLTNVNPSKFTILLSHRPELLNIYASCPIDLVFSGHAHGGQFRLPFLGGIFAPNQGFFPKYTAGIYAKLDTKMVVSRGLGPSSFPIRLNNKPDLVEVILQTTKNK